jgi:asparagine synthase (glutamine-hydrolysing)
VFEPAFLAAVDVAAPLRLAREVYARAMSRSPVNRMMHLDLKITLADNDLRKVSRAAELAGVEARYPLLDDALVAFSGDVPPDLKVRGLKLRYFFKHALRGFLPRETLVKTKHGFGLPFGLWLGADARLAALARESLGAFATRGIVRPRYTEYLLRQHQSGHATYYGVMIWVITMLEQWLRAKKL